MATGGVAAPRRPLPPGLKPTVVRYEDIAAQSGLTGINVSGAEREKQYIIETTGTGVAIFDYDNDGLPDIFLVNGGRLQEGGSPPTHFLYHNLGGLKFEDVTEKAARNQPGGAQGVCAADADTHGITALSESQWGRTFRYRNKVMARFLKKT